MNKKLKSDEGEIDGYNFFENIPDELVIFIFTLLTSSSTKNDHLENVKLLGRCLSVSKRFNALTCLVPTLSLQHDNIDALYKCCPEILQKFKHIRSLQIAHLSRPEIEFYHQGKPLPIIWWEAAYRPHGYCLAVVSYKKVDPYSDDSQRQENIMLSAAAAAAEDCEYDKLFRLHTLDMIYLHHMLFSMIKDHKYLQRVVVTDLDNRGTLTLEEDTLAELRNCTSTNLEQVMVRERSGFTINLDVPDPRGKTGSGLLMTNTCFNIIEWWEKAADDHFAKNDDEGVPSGLPFECPKAQILREILAGVMENPDDVKVTAGKDVVDALSNIKSKGYLF